MGWGANKNGNEWVQEWDGICAKILILSVHARSLDVLLCCILVSVDLRELPHV